MSSLENLNKRLNYRGGISEDRMISDKETTLKRALLHSYQAATAVLPDLREFKCLINPHKETGDYDNKIISIPYRDKVLNPSVSDKPKYSNGEEDVGLKCGDVFTWKETDTKWLVYLEYLEEDAYFRAQIRKCAAEVEIGSGRYWVYIRGPVETSIPWNQKGGIEWNSINYSLVMYVTRDENTVNNLKRFKTLKIEEPETGILKTWQVARVNPYYADGIISVSLDEFYENPMEDASKAEAADSQDQHNDELPEESYYIDGPDEVDAYDTTYFTIVGSTGGEWFVEINGRRTSFGNSDSIAIDVMMSRGSFKVIYKTQDSELVKDIKVLSF